MTEIQSETPAAASTPMDKPARSVFPAMLRGARCRCPACGKGRLYRRYLKVVDECGQCGEALHHQRADDAPPYFTIVAAGHVLLPLMLAVEAAYRPAAWLHALIWGPATIALCLGLLPVIKGAIVGLQWALYMHGFDPDDAEHAQEHDPQKWMPVLRERSCSNKELEPRSDAIRTDKALAPERA